MNEKLNPEVRVKVAGECEPKNWCKNSYGEIVVIENCWPYGGGGYIPNTTSEWLPKTDLRQKDALTRTAARLIDEVDKAALESTSDASTPNEKPMRARWGNAAGLIMKYSKADKRFRKAIAANDTDALERIVAELKGFL